MTPQRFQRLDELLHEALALAEEERAAFLEEAAGGDVELRGEVESLLRAHQRAGDFLEDVSPGLSEEGRRIGPYRLLHELGEGGMSVVYLAVRADGEYEHQVAVKLVKRGLDTASVLRRFRGERQILASLDHPHIAHFYDGGTTPEGRPYFVMEAIEGTAIDEYCDQRRLSTVGRLELLRQVCSAVHYAHRNLVVHRDIKPGNILVTAHGVPRLLDFGIAMLLDPEAFPHTVESTRPGLRPMTPRYASPEQLRGERVTTSTDVFSLGLLLHKLLTGRLPRRTSPDGETTGESVARIAHDLPTDLHNILRMALREEPERRYASAEQFDEDLRRYLEGLPVRARQDTLGYRAGKFLRRHKLGVGMTATFFALVLSFAALMARQVAQTTAALEQTGLERDKAEFVSNFLFDLFESSDPMQARGETVTALELLERGAEKVEALGEQPLVQATALDTIGKVYHELGQFERALPLLEQSLSLRRELLGDEHADVAASLTSLGLLLTSTGDYPRAAALHREALAIRRQLLGEEHPEVADSLHNLGMVRWLEGRYDAAESLLREALALQRRILGEDDPTVATSINDLALVLFEKGDLERAESLYREALALERAILGDNHPEIAVTLNNLSAVLRRQGRYDAAQSMLREAVTIRRQVYGPEHPRIATTLHNLGSLLLNQGEYEEADRYIREALEMRRKFLGEEHLLVAMTLSALASVIEAGDDLEGAASLYRESIEITRKVAPGNPGIAHPLLDLGAILLEKGDPQGAAPILREAYELRRRGLPEDNALTAEAAFALGKCLALLEEYTEAEKLLLESHRIFEQAGNGRRGDTRQSLDQLIGLYEAWGRPEKAAEYRAFLEEP